MSGIVNQTRILKAEPPESRVFSMRNQYGSIENLDVAYFVDGSQSTTSFRTTSRDSDPLSDSPEEMFDRANEPSTSGRMERAGSFTSDTDTGHPFYTIRKVKRLSHPIWTISDPGSSVRMSGPLVPYYGGGYGKYPVCTPLSTSEINVWGSRAIAQCTPTSPHSSISMMLGEIMRDGLPDPHVLFNPLRDRAAFFRNLGSKYLNIEFGWKPFVNDLRNILGAVTSTSKALDQYYRDSGKVVRRKFGFPSVVTTSSTADVNGSTTAIRFLYSNLWSYLKVPYVQPATSLIQSRETQIWFKGAFTYYAEVDKSTWAQVKALEQRANLLFGTRITPEVLWELAPWSWLADWFFNIGSIMTNVSNFSEDGLVMRYGYLMRRQTFIDTYTSKAGNFRVADPGPIAMQLSVVQKERVKATPFGFGLIPNIDFDARQWAILAALGMTRAPRLMM